MFSLLHMKRLKLWKYDSIPYGVCVLLVVYEDHSFCPTTRKREAGVSKSPPLSKSFLNRCVFGDHFHRIFVDGRLNRMKKLIGFQSKKETSRRGFRRSVNTDHFGSSFWSHLTLFVPGVTNINFLPTTSTHHQEETGWELIKLALTGKCFDLLSNRPV